MFNNIKTWYNGHIYDSKGEAYLARHLDQLVRDGFIIKVERQVSFDLFKDGKKDCKHIVDFVITRPNGKKEVREFKGYETERWLYKLQLFVQNYPYFPYLTVKEDRLNRYRTYTPQEILGAIEKPIPEQHKKPSWWEIVLGGILHHIGNLILP